MLLKIDDKLYSAEDRPMAIVFANDEERLHIIKVLSDMEPRDGERWLAMHPQGYFTHEEVEKWTTLNDDERKLMRFAREVENRL